MGLITEKRSPDLTMVVFLKSADGRYDSLYLRNYAVIQVRDVLARLTGMGDVEVFGSGRLCHAAVARPRQACLAQSRSG